MGRLIFATVLLGGLWLAPPALAEPCEGPLPPSGTAFAGTVRYGGDGDSLCVGSTSDPDAWVEVRRAGVREGGRGR
jgi:hypothetical protein